MGGVDAHDERPISLFGEAETSGGSEAGFADASLAAEQKDSHIRRDAIGGGFVLVFKWAFRISELGERTSRLLEQ
jgi:hypothetical protein